VVETLVMPQRCRHSAVGVHRSGPSAPRRTGGTSCGSSMAAPRRRQTPSRSRPARRLGRRPGRAQDAKPAPSPPG